MNNFLVLFTNYDFMLGENSLSSHFIWDLANTDIREMFFCILCSIELTLPISAMTT
ncbi:MAG: hypothetical protein HC877_10995 [Thioploca sp.]|nr:hypothetical protein [Thioploca sp.]